MLTDETVSLRDTTVEELAAICAMEQGDARHAISPYSLPRHRVEFAKPTIVYKSICRSGELAGFMILALDADGQSVELRRIVVAEPGHGIGGRAVGMAGELCRTGLDRRRVWLDVFETNLRARHLYERCGYRQFGTSELEGRTLLLYERTT
jgi:diamine N-acetyltransferase